MRSSGGHDLPLGRMEHDWKYIGQYIIKMAKKTEELVRERLTPRKVGDQLKNFRAICNCNFSIYAVAIYIHSIYMYSNTCIQIHAYYNCNCLQYTCLPIHAYCNCNCLQYTCIPKHVFQYMYSNTCILQLQLPAIFRYIIMNQKAGSTGGHVLPLGRLKYDWQYFDIWKWIKKLGAREGTSYPYGGSNMTGDIKYKIDYSNSNLLKYWN